MLWSVYYQCLKCQTPSKQKIAINQKQLQLEQLKFIREISRTVKIILPML